MIGRFRLGMVIVRYQRMPSALRITFALVALAVAYAPFVFSQRPADANSIAARSSATGNAEHANAEAPLITHDQTYRMFIADVGMSDANLARAIRRNEPLPERRHFSQCLGIRADADLIIYPILSNAFQDIQAAEQVVNNAVVPHRMLSQEEAKQLVPVFAARDRKENATVRDAIANLHEKLGDQDFAKLDAYIFSLEDGGKPWTALKSRNRCIDKCNSEGCSAPQAGAPQ